MQGSSIALFYNYHLQFYNYCLLLRQRVFSDCISFPEQSFPPARDNYFIFVICFIFNVPISFSQFF